MSFREDLKQAWPGDLEKEILEAWEREETFERSLAERRDAPAFVFYEGPPTANGRPGIHHVLSRGMKDFVCRLRAMQGFLVERRGGWDTHGLPVEIETEKRLGLADKRAIEELGIAKFNEACRASVFEYLEDWNRLTRRMGYWVDLENPYITLSRDYMESLWWIFSELHGRGLLYRGHKVLPYCPRCSTPLSSHEVGLGFKDVQDPSVTIRLELEAEDGDEALLVWTTTPWTLPSNLAVAVHPELDYSLVRVTEGEHEGARVWVASARREAIGAEHEVLSEVKGRELVGRRYRRLLDWYPVDATERTFTVVAGDFVTTTDGTGLVHMAPAYGQDDHDVGRREGIPVLHPVDAAGRFEPGSPVEGQFVKDADKAILGHLKEQGSLWHRETLVHSYPHCWRCDSPLLYYARESWYLKTTAFKEQMIRENAEVDWFPASVGTGRFGQWLENNVDWAISRDRYWGTPLPVWLCDVCEAQTAVGSVAELERRSGKPAEDLHRPFVDEHAWPCEAASCSGTMRRTPEVADAWFDSGSMPFAQWHYPFENKEEAEASHPADFICEGVDQTRGWFYTLLAVSMMLTGKKAYRTCVSLDLVLDASGKKMSKSRGNVVDPITMMDRYGADVVRWHLLVRPLGTPLRYETKDLDEIRNRFFGTLLNVHAFFAMYANIDGYTGQEDDADEAPVLDQWLVSRLHGLFRDVTADLAVFDTGRAGRRIADFVVEDLSNWYVRRNRKRFHAAGLGPDKLSAHRTLHAALISVAQLIAPYAPFLSDALYRGLTDGLEGAVPSVHMENWPAADEALIDEPLERGMDALRRVVSLGHAARDGVGIRVRQPLARIEVWGLGADDRAFFADNLGIVAEELNVKQVVLLDDPPPGMTLSAELDKRQAARRLGPQTPGVMAALAALSTEEVVGLLRAEHPRVHVHEFGDVPLEPEDVRVRVLGGGEDLAGEFGAGLLVGLDTALTPELVCEGVAREVVRAVNMLRKQHGLKVEDRIAVRWNAEDDPAACLEQHAAWIAEEILAVTFERTSEDADLGAVEIAGAPGFRVAIRRA